MMRTPYDEAWNNYRNRDLGPGTDEAFRAKTNSHKRTGYLQAITDIQPTLRALVEAAKAAGRYDKAIERHAQHIAQDEPDETRRALADDATAVFVESDDLDTLYLDWMTKSKAAITDAEKWLEEGTK